jgi:hypothetical protein
VKSAKGELALALFFAALGALWIARAAGMTLWDGFAPGSGFMPLWYGVILIALSGAIAFLAVEKRLEEPVGKGLVLLAVIGATIVGFSLAGFAPSIFLMLLVLFAAVERLPLARSVVVAAGVTAVLFLIFRTWLKVPLPSGPLGI